jgi:competence protein ComEC
MVAVIFLGVIADRKALSMRLVAVAASAILIVQPESLLGASFQLSFAAVVALVAAYDTERQEGLRRLGDGLLARSVIYILFVAATTVIATLATTPYAIFHFQRVAIYGLPANLVAVPISALWIMPLGVGALLMMPFGLAGPFLTAMGWGAHIIMRVAEEVAAWPHAVLPLPSMPLPGLVAVTLGGAWLCLWRGRWRYAGAAAVLAGMASVAMPSLPDVLIDADAKVVGVRMPDGGLAFSPTRAAKFEQARWLQQAGMRKAAPWPARADTNAMRCDGAGCVFAVNGRMVALMQRPDAAEDDCRRADVIVSLVPLRGACPRPVAVVDRFDLWRDGAHAIWLEPDAVRVVSVNGLRGDRPWVLRPKPRDRRTKAPTTTRAGR